MWPQILMIVIMTLGFSFYFTKVVLPQQTDDQVGLFIIGLVIFGLFNVLLAFGGFWSSLGWSM